MVCREADRQRLTHLLLVVLCDERPRRCEGGGFFFVGGVENNCEFGEKGHLQIAYQIHYIVRTMKRYGCKTHLKIGQRYHRPS